MKFCKHCGTKIEESTKFCKGCGKKLFNEEENLEEIKIDADLLSEAIIDLTKEEESKQESFKNFEENLSEIEETIEGKVEIEAEAKSEKPRENRIPKPQKIDKVPVEKKKINKKIIIAIAAVLLIAVGIGFMLFKGNSPEGVVKDFEKYLESGEVSKMKEILVTDSSIELSEENVEIFMEGIKGEEVHKEYLIKKLKEEAESFKVANIQVNTGENIFVTKKKEGLKEKYYIGIKPSYIKASEILDGTSYTLKAGDKAVDIALVDGQEHMVMPTVYNLEAKLQNEYIETTDQTVISLVEVERYNVDLFNNVNKVTIETNDGEALLVINGENTKKQLKDIKVLAGLKKGDIIQGMVEKDGKVRTSPKYTIEGTEKIYIEVEPEKVINHLEYTNKVPEVVDAYIKGMADAVNYNDFGVIKDYLYPGSQIYNEQIKFIKNTNESGIREYYIAHFIDDSNYDDEKKEWTVRVNETFDIDNGKGETSRKIFNNEYKLKVNEDLEKLQISHIKVNYK